MLPTSTTRLEMTITLVCGYENHQKSSEIWWVAAKVWQKQIKVAHSSTPRLKMTAYDNITMSGGISLLCIR